jgi:hypothetical protein
MKKVFWFTGILSILFIFVSSALGATYYVAPGGTGDCSSQANACDFQTALDNAAGDSEDSTIYVGSGIYNLTSTLTYSVPDGDDSLRIEALDS